MTKSRSVWWFTTAHKKMPATFKGNTHSKAVLKHRTPDALRPLYYMHFSYISCLLFRKNFEVVTTLTGNEECGMMKAGIGPPLLRYNAAICSLKSQLMVKGRWLMAEPETKSRKPEVCPGAPDASPETR
jgi:hypothetical protein